MIDDVPHDCACHRCRQEFAAEELKRTSLPPLLGMLSITDIEPGDTQPPLVLMDHHRYCCACRRQIHAIRVMQYLAAIIVMVGIAVLAGRLLS